MLTRFVRYTADCYNFTQDGAPALIIAAQRGHDAVVKLLLEEGANSEAPNKVVIAMTQSLHIGRLSLQ